MLNYWQEQFPAVFKAHQITLTHLPPHEQNLLDTLLTQIMETGLLDESVVDQVLGNSYYAKELTYLVTIFSRADCLTTNTLQGLLKHGDLSSLADSINEMEDLSLLSSDLLQLLGTAPDSQSVMKFIKCVVTEGIDFELIRNFLSTQIVMNGFSRAHTLFEYSSYTYTTEHFDTFALLTSILANPLCQTIFDARLRSFSDYSQSFEPLGYHSVADRIITSLQESADEEQRIAIFFDYFTHYRPFPGSQRYIVDIDLADKVLNALTTYCQERIAAINTREDYLTTKQLIKQIQQCGGNQFLFDTIKYDVASAIEAEDMCSMRTYADHMNAIAEVLKKPQTSLADFSESLKNSTGYQQMITTHMQGNTLLMSASPSTGPSPETQLSLVVQP